jgi:hypothetical protein
MCGENHVAAPLEHIDLLRQRPWHPPQIGRGNHIEDGLARCSNGERQRSQWSDVPTKPGVQRQLPAHDKPVADGAGHGRRR